MQILKIPYRLLAPIVVLFCIVGTYSLKSNVYDILIMVTSGFLGFILRSYKFDLAPLIFTMVIAPMMEMNFRQGLIMARGDVGEFLGRPTAAFLWLVIVLILFSPLIRRLTGWGRSSFRR